jgi:F0F1-type ATP synthase delta subunit
MSLSRTIAKVIMEKSVTVSDVTSVLKSHNLLALLPQILKALKQMNVSSRSENTILVESPFPLSENAIARIKRIVGNDIAPHIAAINKDLLTGFKARFRGRLYDGSAERIIKQLLTN